LCHTGGWMGIGMGDGVDAGLSGLWVVGGAIPLRILELDQGNSLGM